MNRLDLKENFHYLLPKTFKPRRCFQAGNRAYSWKQLMFSIANTTQILCDIRITVFGAARTLSTLDNDHYWL